MRQVVSFGGFAVSMIVVLGFAGPLRAQPENEEPMRKGEVEVSEIEYQGYPRCLRLSNGEVEVVATTEIGPRILSYRLLPDGPNVLLESKDQLGGRSGEIGWVGRGGHRLWVGPEDPARTYAPDNSRLSADGVENGVLLTQQPDEFGIEKSIEIKLAPTGPNVTITHTLSNVGKEPVEVAPWALTVLKPGGVEILPLPAPGNHPGGARDARGPADFAPSGTLVFWPYFKFTDDRWSFGDRFITLTPRDRGPTKLGLALTPGWAAYLNEGQLFVKFVAFQPQRRYPDRGVNYETFTSSGMVEMESLGPLVILGPGGDWTDHVERWSLSRYKGASTGTADEVGAGVAAVVGGQ